MRDSHVLRRVIVLAAGALLLAACGGGEDDPTLQSSPGGQDAAGGATPTGQAGGGSDDGESQAAGSGDFADLATQGFTSAEARVTYDMTAGGQTQEMVLSSDGEQTAWLMPQARMIIRADGTQIFCNEGAGQAQCFRMTGQAPDGAMAATPFMGMATAFQEGIDSFPGFTRTGEREIAGRTAMCGTFDPSQLATGGQQAGEATLCLDSETGVMLSWEATDAQGSASSLTATDFGEPQASDFEAPAEPQSMDQMMEGMGQGG